nr:MAG TPA: hypothetical protein [Caudoviricetes sp.]
MKDIFLFKALHLKCIYLCLISFGRRSLYFSSKFFLRHCPKHLLHPTLLSTILSFLTLSFLPHTVQVHIKYIRLGVFKSISSTFNVPIVFPIYFLYLLKVFFCNHKA